VAVDAAGGVGGETKDLWVGGSDEPVALAVNGSGDATVVWLNFDDTGAPSSAHAA